MTNYGLLKSAISGWLNRTDLEDRIPEFIRLAEADIFRTLRCRDNEFIVDLDSNSPDQSPTVLPDNFLELRGIYWNNRPLSNISKQSMEAKRRAGEEVEAVYVTIAGRQAEYYADIPSNPADWQEDDTLSLWYYGFEDLTGETPEWQTGTNPPASPGFTPTPAADDNQTRLLLRQPNLYLYGALHHAHDYLQKHDEADRWLAKFGQVMAAIENASAEAEFTASTAVVQSPYEDI